MKHLSKNGRWGWAVMWGALLALPAQGVSLCKTQISVPGLPQVSCRFPSCPSGGDCHAPVIQTSQSRVEFFEPLLRWRENCPDLNAPCWEVYMDVRFDVAASDPSGISEVGVVLYEESRGQRKNRTLWAPVKSNSTVYSAQKAVTLFALPRATLEIGVLETCARDRLGNEQCQIPSTRPQWRLQQ